MEQIPIAQWALEEVLSWLRQNKLDAFENNFQSFEVTGDILQSTDHAMLQEIGIWRCGDRLRILHAVQQLRKTDPTQIIENVELYNDCEDWQNTYKSLKSDSLKIPRAEQQEIAKLNAIIAEKADLIDNLNEKVNQLSSALSKIQSETENIKLTVFHLSSNENDKGRKSPKKSPTISNMIYPKSPSKSPMPNLSQTDLSVQQPQSAIKVYGDKLLDRGNEPYKSIMVHIDDTCSKILPLVLKKYKIVDDWKKFALFMHFRNQERCLSYDDKPLKLQYQYRDEQETPVFLLKSIRAEKALNEESAGPSMGRRVLSDDREEHPSNSNKSSIRNLSLLGETAQSEEEIQTAVNLEDYRKTNLGRALGIYEYKADREDELDVNIGDSFIIRDSTVVGWWIASRTETSRIGWIPSGCLVENNEAADARADGTVLRKGIALYNYTAGGGNELSVQKGDVMVVHKKYQHWLLATVNGSQGWVPSCYVSMEKKRTENGQTDRQTDLYTPGLSPAVSSSDLADKTLKSPLVMQSNDNLEQSSRPKVETSQSDLSGSTDQVNKASTVETRDSETGGSGAITKLSDLLAEMDPYVQENMKKQPQLSSNTSLNTTANHSQASTIKLNEDPISRIGKAQDLIEEIATLDPNSPRYSNVLSRLEAVIENGRLRTANVLPAPYIGRPHDVDRDLHMTSTINQTQEVITNVINALLEQIRNLDIDLEQKQEAITAVLKTEAKVNSADELRRSFKPNPISTDFDEAGHQKISHSALPIQVNIQNIPKATEIVGIQPNSADVALSSRTNILTAESILASTNQTSFSAASSPSKAHQTAQALRNRADTLVAKAAGQSGYRLPP